MGEAVAFLVMSSLYWPGLRGTSELSSASARAQFSTLREILAAARGLGASRDQYPAWRRVGLSKKPCSMRSAYRVFIHVCAYVCGRACVLEGRCGGQFSPSTIWGPGISFRSPGLPASTFAQ